jgi:TetR/AcrR family transcriptional regulator
MAVRAKTKSAKRQTRDREATQLALVAAAETIFAEHGYKGATLDLLAEETGANKALVSYYFGSKEGLYDAVIASMASDVVADVKAQMEETGDPAKNFTQYVRALARAFAARPTFAAILMREYIGGTMQEREGPFQQVFQFFRMTEKLYKDGRRKKAFRNLDPHLLHLSIVGPLVHFTLTMGFRERTFKKLAADVENPTVDAFADHLSGLLLDGMR